MGGERWHNVEHRDIHTVHALNGIFYEFFPCIICIWNLFFKRRKDNSDLDNLQRLWEMKLLKFLSSPFRYLHFSNAHVYQWGFFSALLILLLILILSLMKPQCQVCIVFCFADYSEITIDSILSLYLFIVRFAELLLCCSQLLWDIPWYIFCPGQLRDQRLVVCKSLPTNKRWEHCSSWKISVGGGC